MPSRRPTPPSSRRPASRPSGARGTTSRGSASRPTTTANGSVGAPPARPSSSRSGGRPSSKTPAKASSSSSKAGSSRASSGKGAAERRGSRRPTGPAREDRRRSRYGLVLPEVLTVRLLVLSVVVLLAVVLVLPTLRGAVQQAGELDDLRAELAAHQAEQERLTEELARWDDRSYVEEQARSRLSFVMPSDRVWRVVDPDAVEEADVDPVTGQAVDAGPVGTSTAPGVPWYQSVWESVQVADGPAGATGPAEEPGASPSPTPSR